MKKFICFLLMFMIAGSTCMAEDTEDVISERTIHVNVEQGTVMVDGQTIECPAPYVTGNGITMMALSIISEVLGGVEISQDGDRVSISYSDANMSLTIGSREFETNSQIIEMPESAIIIEQQIMVPLRFLFESFGAEISYDAQTNDITITISGQAGAEVDFKMLLKYGNKSKVGNSKQKWCFNKPDDFDMEKGYFSDDYTFYAEDISFSLAARKNTKNITFDQFYIAVQYMAESSINTNSYLSYGDGGVIYHKSKGIRSGLPYVSVKLRKSNQLVEFHGFLTDGYIYLFEVTIPYENNFAEARENATIELVLDSFKTGYDGGDDQTIDISKNAGMKDENDDYENENFGWTIVPQDDWTINDPDGYVNRVSISRQSDLNDDELTYSPLSGSYSSNKDYISDAVLTVSIYSNPDNQSITEWVDENVEHFKSSFNPEFIFVEPVIDTTVGQHDAKSFYTEINYLDYTRCTKSYFIYDKDYRYMLILDYDKRDGQQDSFWDSTLAMLNSFKTAELNIDDVGDILTIDGPQVTNALTRQFDHDDFTFTLPYLWNSLEMRDAVTISENTDYYSYISGNYGMMISKMPLEKVDDKGNLVYQTLDEYAEQSIIEIKKTYLRDVSIDQPLQKTSFKERTAYEYSYTLAPDQSSYYRETPSTVDVILVEHNDTDCYAILRLNKQLYKGTSNDKIYDEIIDSIQFK